MYTLLPIARTAAQNAGAVIMDRYAEIAYELKEDHSPVTVADTAAHHIILDTLSQTNIPILSEEALGIPLPYPEHLWVVDPLDGTKGFIKKTGDFSVMIALLERGRPVLAVVYAPYMKKEYYAILGKGSYLFENSIEKRIYVSNRTGNALRGLLSVNHAAPYMIDVMHTIGVQETVSIGSVGIKAGYIGEDRADFYVTHGALGEWDVCAPELILTEAGGRVTDTNGNLLCYGNDDHRIKHGLVLSNGMSHDAVLAALQSAQ
jgi:3'(2'), 5'-bisphosphate nucleotidase